MQTSWGNPSRVITLNRIPTNQPDDLQMTLRTMQRLQFPLTNKPIIIYMLFLCLIHLKNIPVIIKVYIFSLRLFSFCYYVVLKLLLF